MKHAFFRRRSLAYKERGTRPFSLKAHPFLKLALWGYFVVCFVVLATRLFFTTMADNYRDEIAALISEAIGVNVEAGEFKAGFEQFWPQLTLSDVRLSRPGGPVALTLPRVTARFSWSSVWHLEPRFELLRIEDPTLTIRRLDKQRFDVAGFVITLPDTAMLPAANTNNAPAEPSDNRIAAWLLAQKKFELANGTIAYLDQYNYASRVISVTDTNFIFEKRLLDWRVALEGTAHVPETDVDTKGEYFTVVGHVNRKIFTDTRNPLTWEGRAYARFEHANIARLLKKINLPDVIRSGSGELEVWSEFANGHITSATADTVLHNIHAQLDGAKEPLRIDWLGSRFFYKSEENDHTIATFGVEQFDFLAASGKRLHPTDATVTLHTDVADHLTSGVITISRVDIAPFVSLVPQLPLDDEVRDFVVKHKPNGQLTDVNIAFVGNPADPGNWRPNARFTNLSLAGAENGVPGFRKISGNVSPMPNGEGIRVAIDSADATLSFPGLFRHPDMHFDTLKAEVEILPHPILSVNFPSYSAANKDAALEGRGSWLATGGPGTLDLTGRLLRGTAEAVPNYLPLVIGDQVLDYLEAALISGRGSNGTFVVRGPLDTFPWDGKHKNEGRFAIEADATNATFDFLPSQKKRADGSWETGANWPLLKNIDAHLAFIGNGFEIRGKTGNSLGLTASNVVVGMKSYTASPLVIKGRVQGDLSNALRYLNEGAMLRDLLSSAFSASTGKGPVDMTLDLSIPLQGDIVKGLKVGIDAGFENAEFYYGLNLPVVSQAKGRLHITQSSVSTPAAITGVSPDGGPVAVTATTKKGILTLGIDAEPTTNELEKFLNLDIATPFFKALTGRTSVHVDANIGISQPLLSVLGTTDLTGVESTLPRPYAKRANTSWPSTFRVTFPEKTGMRIDIQSPKRADVSLVFAQKSEQLDLRDAFVGLGNVPTAPIGKGIQIRLNTPYVDINKWWPYIFQDSSKNTGGDDFVTKLSVVDAHAINAVWSGKLFKNVDLTARRFAVNDWHLRVSGDEAAGQLEYNQPVGTTSAKLKVNLTRLTLPDSTIDSYSSEEAVKDKTPPADLPDVSLVIDDLNVGKRNIGKVELQAVNRQEGDNRIWNVSTFAVRNSGGTIDGRGSWVRTPGRLGVTSIAATGKIVDAGRLLNNLDIQDAVRGAATTIQADLSWKNAPHRFDVGTLNGSVAIEASHGEILQVEPGAGRLLSLLSMQHLMRRLTLDFRDVLGKGFAFDSASATGTLQNGVLTIPKASVLGSAASVLLGGKVNLKAEKLDIDAIILPAINAGGPALALAIVNPAIGISTFLTQWLLKDQLSHALRMEYKVTGSFDEPSVEKAARQNLKTDTNSLASPMRAATDPMP